jgi:nonsense-mediated mRNA decay protein 3
MICYQCGKREARIDGLCEPCFLEDKPSLFVKNLKILQCRECGRYFFKLWRDSLLVDIIKEYSGLEDADFFMEERDYAYSVTVVARQIFHKDQTHPLVQQTQFIVYVRSSLCNTCSKMLSGYYEAILQVRRENSVLTEEERHIFSDMVTSALRPDDFISRIQEKKEGTNYYFSSTKAAKRTAEILRRRLGGIIKDSYHIMGLDRQKSTDIKRGTILFQLHQYKEGDILYVQGSVYEVKRSQRKLHLKNAEEKKVLPWKKVEYLKNKNEVSLLSPSEYCIAECQILDVNPSQVLIMLPDYTTLYLKRPKGIKVDIGNRYRILFFQEHTCWM